MVKNVFGLLRREDLELIEKAIERVEKETSGEIVLKCAPASSNYYFVRSAGTILGFIFGCAAVMVTELIYHWSLASYDVITILVAGGVLGLAVCQVPLILKWILPDSVKERTVERAAYLEFFQLGLYETRDRTGILIYVSALEQRVRLIADKGIHSKLGKDIWQKEVDLIVEGIKKQETAKAVVTAINDIGTELKKYFPRKEGETNELPNRVRLGQGVLIGEPDTI